LRRGARGIGHARVTESDVDPQTEALGNYSVTENYATGTALGVYLTDDEVPYWPER
jgi:hypothetical protein